MCGISGIINKSNVQVSDFSIREINDLISHRGPDGEGFYFGDNFALGHRRLSIIDLSEGGAQPMTFGTDQYVITFNGEIYNYVEIKNELKNEGYVFNSESDTEVILAAYDKYGVDCVNHFNGMWSFAIFDKLKNILLCSRDRFGIKPFYYSNNSDSFIFGSEIKQVIHTHTENKYNKQVLLDYLIGGFEECTNDTFFEGVEKLQQGHNLTYDLSSHEINITPYYSIHIDSSLHSKNEEESVKAYSECLHTSIALRMRSDVEVGVCLSGGLDSSSVVSISSALLKESSNKKINTIHANSTEKATNETAFAKKVADFCDAELNEVQPTYSDFKNVLDQVIKGQEEPFGSASIIMQYFVLKEARSKNCIVMLDGQGGDETLLGYEKYYPAYLMSLKGIKKFKAFINSSKNSKLCKKDLLAYYVYFTKYKVRLKRLKSRHKYVKPEVLANYNSSILKNITKSYKDITSLQKLELQSTQLPHLLKYEDKNSMLHSVEARLPFLDYHCVETALSLPNEFKIKDGWTKYLLRKTIDKKLPDDVTWRKNKLGFNAPENEWLSKLKPEMIAEINQSKVLDDIANISQIDFVTIGNKQLWRLFNIAKWEKLMNVTV